MKKLLSVLVAIYSGSALAVDAVAPATDAVKIYQMDLFSLISFALAIAALLLSIFMAWLSWEFYKKSTEASDKTQQAVTKIETAVLSIQSEITEIVRRAVGYWTGGDESNEVADQSAALSTKFEELSAQIKLLAGTAANKQDLEAKLAELVRLQKEQVASLSLSVTDAKARALFPSIDRGPVSQFTQSFEVNSDTEKSGELVVSVLRPSRIATATGKFTPIFSAVPVMKVDLINAPSPNVRVTYGVGTTSDFNIHLISETGLLETGTYVFKFTAKVPTN
jgi:hypothetical protein